MSNQAYEEMLDSEITWGDTLINTAKYTGKGLLFMTAISLGLVFVKNVFVYVDDSINHVDPYDPLKDVELQRMGECF